MAEDTLALPTLEDAELEELRAVEGELLRGVSLLRMLTRAAADDETDHAELEVSLEIATKHLDDAHNRMELALMRIRRERRA